MRFNSRFYSPLFWLPLLLSVFDSTSHADEPVAGKFEVNAIQRAPRGYAITDVKQLSTAITETDPQFQKLVGWLQAQTTKARQNSAVVHVQPASSSVRPISGAQQIGLAQLQQKAGPDLQVRIRPDAGTPLLIKGKSLEPRFSGLARANASLEEMTARSFLRSNKDLLRIDDPDLEFRLIKSETDELGYHHLRFEQWRGDLPVWPCETMVHLDRAGAVYLMNGTYIPSPRTVEHVPQIQPADAIARAQAQLIKSGEESENTAPDLIIYGPLDSPARLAWKFDLTASLEQAWTCVVDATDGRILASISLVKHVVATGSGLDARGISRNLNLWDQNGTFYMVDCSKAMFDQTSQPPFNGRGVILIYDGGNKEVMDPQFSAGLMQSRTANSGWEGDAIGAAFGLSETYDYYRDRFGRNSLDAQGGNIRAIVRYGNNVANAFWFGGTRTMVFGAGFTREIDISGHELTHGVIDSVGNGGILEYRRQSGALNEALADIFGEMVEARFKGASPDWLKADPFEPENRDKLLQDYANPTSVKAFTGDPNPSKMSEFIRLNDDQDNGGVHVNSSIINHCFYLLAIGMDGALGMRDAEQVFYRAMTTHLQKQSQFIDMRHACVSAAEEVFGRDSVQAQKTAEAFTRVEIEDAPTTPAPAPLPSVAGPDSTLALRLDPFANQYFLVRREAALGDGDLGSFVFTGDYLAPRRVSVSGNGSFCVFVTALNDVASINTDGTDLSFGDVPGLVHSVAAAPDGNHYALVVNNQQTLEPLNEIWIIRLNPPDTRRIKLTAPGTEGADLDVVKFADTMYFRSDSQSLVYDAYTEIKTQDGQALGSWTLFSMDLLDGSISTLININEGLDFGNPSLGKTRNNLITFEVIDHKTGVSTLFASDLQTGDKAEIGKLDAAGSIGIPGYNGDDTAIVYAQVDPSVPSGFSLLSQPMAADGVAANGQPSLWMRDADLGVVYRRGQFVSSNAVPSIRLTAPSGQVHTAPARFIIEATASDPDGQVAKVEFYDGSTKLLEMTAPPYRLEFSDVPAKQFRFIARAIDNLGGAQDSEPLEVTITSTGGGTAPGLQVARQGTELTISWPASATGFVLQAAERLSNPTSWTDLTVTPTVSGQQQSITITPGSAQRYYRLTRR